MSEDNNPTTREQDGLSVERLYEECGIRYRYHIDWRYRMFTRYSVAVSALLVAASWLYTNENGKLAPLTYLPFVAIVAVSTAFSIIAFRNKQIFDRHERLGVRLEKTAKTTGIYTECSDIGNWPPPYNVMFPAFYGAIGIAALIMTIILFLA